MHSLKEIQLLCNKQFKLNFNGGELSSDGGLLMIKEFISAIGLERIIKDTFKTTDTAIHKDHKDHENKQNTDCSDYCNRGRMENFIEECKDGFDFASVSSKSKVVNANRLQFHTFVYNIFNLFRRLVLPGEMRKHLIDTVRLKLLKVATKVVHS